MYDITVMMLVTRTIKGRIEDPTMFKLDCIEHEYNGFQKWMIFGIDANIYSSYKAAKGFKIKNIKYHEYPLILWSKLTELKERKTKVAKYWLRFRTKLKRGGIWLPIKLYQSIPKNCVLKDSLLIYNHKQNWYEVRLVFVKEFEANGHSNILAIDLGEKVMATVVCGNQKKPVFLGREIRGIRRHYSWLRKRLGNKKLLKVIKQVGKREHNKVNSLLHEISREIICLANQHQVGFVFLGDLKGLRESTRNKGRRIRRIVRNFTYYKLTQYITYKAEAQGIQVIQVDERGTSQSCSKCGEIGKRPYQGLFKCSNCSYQINADYNGAKNIFKRGMDYMSVLGASACAHNLSLR